MSKTTTVQNATQDGVNAAAQTASTAGRRGRRVDPNSALSQARLLYDAIGDRLTQPQVINAFVGNLGISKGVARTYYHNIREAAEKAAGTAPTTTGRRGRRANSNAKVKAAADGPKRGPGRPKGSKSKGTATAAAA